MTATAADAWARFSASLCACPSIGLTLDVSTVGFEESLFDTMASSITSAFDAMAELEKGGIANPDENRMVGHYWLRNAGLAPTPELQQSIASTVDKINAFARDVHAGKHGTFTHLLNIGIGGSALGPMFVADALGQPGHDRIVPKFVDNTDPDGVARTLAELDGKLAETIVIVTSKSGGTPETRNGMLLVKAAYERAGLDFAKHVVAITGEGSKLDQVATSEGWLERFPMWDWVGGRTSELATVGLVPAALQGIDIDQMLAGAGACDEVTRAHDARTNPAMLLALMWHHVTGGRGEKDMVVLPYKDRLLLFSRYLQQLVMESLGKKLDLSGAVVEQGIAVYGNKGSTDQHAYVQQLRDGVNNFFAVFVRVLEAGPSETEGVEVEPGVSAGDYLHGFLLGTREALAEGGREALTITVPRVDAFHVGVLIALFERAVGFYASLVNINAYHQPGVEAGKKAAAGVLELQQKVIGGLGEHPADAAAIAQAVGATGREDQVFMVLEHLAANGRAVQAGHGAGATFSRKAG
ncbi:MAG: glucose-6-phosphate isomerase [Planctomycetota bacterium]